MLKTAGRLQTATEESVLCSSNSAPSCANRVLQGEGRNKTRDIYTVTIAQLWPVPTESTALHIELRVSGEPVLKTVGRLQTAQTATGEKVL